MHRVLPSLFLSHGGGPCFFMDGGGHSIFSAIDKHSASAAWYRQVATQLKMSGAERPRAIVIMSAHWSTDQYTISYDDEHGELNYDYYGFPKETYELQYRPAGNKQLAQKIHDILKGAGLPASLKSKHKFDHGVFIPLKLVYPDADVPVVQVSMRRSGRSWDVHEHWKVGELLSSLRQDNVLVIGSGQTTHDLSFTCSDAQARAFVHKLNELVTSESSDVRKQVLEWEKLPYARAAHPDYDHLVPIFFAMGAGAGVGVGGDGKQSGRGERIGSFWAGAMSLDSWKFE